MTEHQSYYAIIPANVRYDKDLNQILSCYTER